MIRTLLATTAIATLVASGAMAQTTAPATTTAPAASEPQQPMVKKAEGHLASDVIGKSVYNGTGDDAKNIGKVSDLVLATREPSRRSWSAWAASLASDRRMSRSSTA
nr:PRC-barrel domain protein [uncultured bacterium]